MKNQASASIRPSFLFSFEQINFMVGTSHLNQI